MEKQVDRQVQLGAWHWRDQREPQTEAFLSRSSVIQTFAFVAGPLNDHVGLRRDEVDVPGFHRHIIQHLADRQPGFPRQDFGHQGFVIGRDMLDRDESVREALRRLSDQLLDGIKTAADAPTPMI